MPQWSDDDYIGYGGYSSYYGGGHSYSGRGRYNRSEQVTFYRPDRSTESKNIGWCLDSDFYEIDEGLWSGDWYYKHFPEKKRAKEQAKEERLQQQKKRLRNEIDSSCDPEGYDTLRTRRALAKLEGTPVESYEERTQKRKKRLRDEIDSSCDPNGCATLRARRELAELEGTLCKCLLAGCQETFLTEDEMMVHLAGSRGNGHIRYCNSNAIESHGKKYLEDWHAANIRDLHKMQARMPQNLNTERSKVLDEAHANVSLSKKKVSPPKTVTTHPSNQKDIRSFFQLI